MLQLMRHKDDKMTPLERSQAIASGSEFDRLPVSLFINELKARLINVSMDQLVTNTEAIVQEEVEVFNRYGADGLSCGPNSHGIAKAMGSPTVFPKNGLPTIPEPLLSDYSQLSNLEPIDPQTDGFIKQKLEACEQLAEMAHGVVGISTSVGGPMTIAAYLRGTENLLRDLRKDSEHVKELLDLVLASQKNCIDAFAPYGVSISLGDPVSSGSVLSPKLFRQFSKPYLTEIARYAKEKTGKAPSLHICGKTERIWNDLLDLPIASYSLDNISDLEEAKAVLGNKLALVGNVPPVEVMYDGGQQEIEAAVKSCVQKAYDTPAGYTIAFGCDMPPSAPLENLDYFMKAARHYGSFDYLKQL